MIPNVILSCTSYFRDQNFGLNELAAIQEVRNEYNLQDITDEPPSSAQTTNDRGKHQLKQIVVFKTTELVSSNDRETIMKT